MPYVLAAVILLASGVFGLVSLAWMQQNEEANAVLKQRIEAASVEITRLRGEGEKVQQQLTPEQKAVLSASHKLVANKTFGWSRLFADLESVLPASVAASKIAVQNVYSEGDRVKAVLELAVISRDYAAVQAMMQNMQNSGLFLPELRGQDLQQGDVANYTEYKLHIIYSPGYGYSAAANDVARNGSEAGN